ERSHLDLHGVQVDDRHIDIFHLCAAVPGQFVVYRRYDIGMIVNNHKAAVVGTFDVRCGHADQSLNHLIARLDRIPACRQQRFRSSVAAARARLRGAVKCQPGGQQR
ncbi:hypothetical protein RZS08_51675, partial [Arthrospira platensis SPKY1]|nr:hypothetical protein [Arthrospira platensis SPKY1]